jgi:hypothetical protein
MSVNTYNAPASSPRRLVETPITARRLLGRNHPQAHASPASTPTFRGSSSIHRARGSQGAASLENLITASTPARMGRPYPSIPMEPSTGAGPPLLPSTPIGTGLPYNYSFSYSTRPANGSFGDPRSPLMRGSSGLDASGPSSNSVQVGGHHGADQSAFSPATRSQVISGKRK